MGSVIGLSIFGTLLTHNLMTELPKHIPSVPGVSAPATMDLSKAQEQAMDPNAIHRQIDKALAEQYTLLERAFNGDEAAVKQVMADQALPDQLKSLLKDGGVRGKAHVIQETRARDVADGLKRGEAGRAALLESSLPAALKDQIRAIPADDLKGVAKSAAVAEHFREMILADEKAEADKSVAAVLAFIKPAMQKQGDELADTIEKGVKEGFSVSITALFGTALWIILVAFVTTFFIPVLPLRHTTPAEDREKAAMATSH
jgi:hypothetical protein